MSQTVKLRRSATSGSVPTTSALALGELAINTYDGKLYLKKSVSGTETIVEIGANNLADTFNVYEYAVTSNTTVFSGADQNGTTLAYTTGSPPKVAVFLNGLLLDWGTDFTATNGTSVTLTSAAVSGDLVQIQAYKSEIYTGSNLTFPDNVKALFGNDSDLQIYHDSSHSYIRDVGTGNLHIDGTRVILRSASSANMVKAIGGGAVELYHNAVKKFETTASGVQIQGSIAATTDAYLPIIYGGSSLLQLKSNTGEMFAQFANNGAAQLYHDNVKKFETTSTGVDVSGNLDASGSVFFNSDLRANNVSNKLIIKASSTTTELHAAGNSGIVFKDSGNGQVAALDTSGNLTTSGVITANGTSGSSFYGITLTRSSSGTTTPDLWGSSGTLVIGTSSSDEVLGMSGTAATFYGTLASGTFTSSGDVRADTHFNSTDTNATLSATGSGNVYLRPNGKSSTSGQVHIATSGNATFSGTISSGAITSTGSSSFGNITTTGYLRGPSTFTIDPAAHGDDTGTVVIAGNLTVNGSTTTLNTATLTVDDLNITVADGAANAAAANGAGLTVAGAGATLIYASSDDSWAVNKRFKASSDIRLGSDGVRLSTDGNGEFGVGYGQTATNNRFTVYNNTTPAFRILPNGNVGIGTNSPEHKLEISTAMGTSPTSVIFLRQTGTNQNGGGGAIRFDTSASNNANTLYYASVEGIRSTSSNGSNELHFKTTKTGVNNNAPTTKMVIDEDGNVGIGTTSPTEKLQFNVLSGTTESIFFEDNSSGNYGFKLRYIESSNKFQIQGLESGSQTSMFNINRSDGRVGIGTDSPDRQLELEGQGVLRLNATGSNTDPGIDFNTASTNDMQIRYRGATDKLAIYSYGTSSDVVTIQKSDGNVGIGTNSPTSKVHISGTSDGSGSGADAMLHVKQNGSWNGNEPWALYVEGYSYLNGFRINAADGIRSLYKTTSGGTLGFATSDTAPITFTQSNSAEKMRIHSNGFVGIGNTNPKARLSVDHYGIHTTSTSTSATTQTVIHTMSASDFRSARFTIQVTNSTDSTYHTTEILMVHDGTNANITEFGKVFTANEEATFDADVSAGNVRLFATPATTDSMQFKVVCHSITV